MSAPGRPPALHDDLPPTIAVDPGRHTAMAVRIGTRPVATATVLSLAAPRAGQRIAACPPDPDALAQVIAEIARLARDHAGEARAWWAEHGTPVAEDQDPWLLAVEKTILPVDDPARGYEVTPDILGPLPATAFIGSGVAAVWGLERVQWVRPHLADTRYQRRYGGTGRPQDYWPPSLLLADEDGREDREGVHLRAAWHHATDAAQDYERDCLRRHGRLLPPHEVLPAPALTRALLTAATATGQPGTPPAAATAAATRTATLARIPAPRTAQPDSEVVLAEIRRLVAAAEAANRPVLEVVREHLVAEEPDPLDAPATWTAYETRRRALLAAAAAA